MFSHCPLSSPTCSSKRLRNCYYFTTRRGFQYNSFFFSPLPFSAPTHFLFLLWAHYSGVARVTSRYKWPFGFAGGLLNKVLFQRLLNSFPLMDTVGHCSALCCWGSSEPQMKLFCTFFLSRLACPCVFLAEMSNAASELIHAASWSSFHGPCRTPEQCEWRAWQEVAEKKTQKNWNLIDSWFWILYPF